MTTPVEIKLMSDDAAIQIVKNLNNMTVKEIHEYLISENKPVIVRALAEFYIGASASKKYNAVDLCVLLMFLEIDEKYLKFRILNDLYYNIPDVNELVNIYNGKNIYDICLHIAKNKSYEKHIVITGQMIFNMIGIEKLYEINSWIILTKTYTNYIINRLITEKKQSVNVVTETSIEAPPEPLKSDNTSENISEIPTDLPLVISPPQDNELETSKKNYYHQNRLLLKYSEILLDKLLRNPGAAKRIPDALIGALINTSHDESKQNFIKEILKHI